MAATSPQPSHTAERVPLRVALDAAWQRAVVAREAEAQLRRTDAARLASQSLWAAPPSLTISHRDDRLQGNDGRRETELGVALPLWLPGQRDAHQGVTTAASAQAVSAEQAARLQLAGELREQAWAWASLAAEVTQAEGQVQSLQRLADDVGRRVRAGELARADVLAAQAEHLAAEAALTDARQRLELARTRWVQLTGLTAAPDLVAVPESAAEPAMTSHPELQSATQATELALRRVELMRHSRRDAPELTVGVRQDHGGSGAASEDSVVVGLRLPFGGDARNRPLESAALAELDVAQTRLQRLRERVESDATLAREAVRAAELQREAGTTRARLLRERAELIGKSFDVGETPLPDLLRALAAAAEADAALARHTAALGLARARLQQALGLLP
ncbi:MAG: TolC family protein [Gammaproteobacteria bacterium]